MARTLDAHPGARPWRELLLSEPRRPAAIRGSRHAHWYVVATVCIGAFMGQLDASIVTLALPTLAQSLHASASVVEWVALAYLLVLVATVATIGHLADAVGRKLLYVYGFAVFTAGSVLCGLSPSLAVLIGARVLQAIGAAMLQANSVALIAEAVPHRLLARALGVQGTAQALGLALGPLAGGLLLALGGWRLIFLVNAPAGVIGLVLGWFLLPRRRCRRDIGRGDPAGAVALAAAAGGLLVYLSLAARRGYASPPLLASLSAGMLATALFVARERRAAAPVVDFAILRLRAVCAGLSTGLLSYMAMFGTLFVAAYYLSAAGTRPALAGAELAVLPVAIGLSAPIAGRVAARGGGRALTAGGLVLSGIGLLVIASLGGTRGLLAGLALAGVGLGAFTPANTASIMGAAPEGRTGVVGGLLNMTRGVGTALGVAVASLLYLSSAGVSSANVARATPEAAARGLSASLSALGAAVLLAGAALALRAGPARAEHEPQRARGAADLT